MAPSKRHDSLTPLDRISGSNGSRAASGVTDRELRLTAALYARHGAAAHLRETGRLPDVIGGPWSIIPMRHILEERGPSLELTEDERLIYEAIIRERRLPGGAVRLLDPKPKGE
jgi:hypothetical protein